MGAIKHLHFNTTKTHAPLCTTQIFYDVRQFLSLLHIHILITKRFIVRLMQKYYVHGSEFNDHTVHL